MERASAAPSVKRRLAGCSAGWIVRTFPGKVAQMPCCAFAACIVAQLLVGIRAIKRAWFGPGAGEFAERNVAVEWRLDSAAAASLDLAPASRGWVFGRRSLRGLALAAALEIVIVLGAIY